MDINNMGPITHNTITSSSKDPIARNILTNIGTFLPHKDKETASLVSHTFKDCMRESMLYSLLLDPNWKLDSDHGRFKISEFLGTQKLVERKYHFPTQNANLEHIQIQTLKQLIEIPLEQLESFHQILADLFQTIDSRQQRAMLIANALFFQRCSHEKMASFDLWTDCYAAYKECILRTGNLALADEGLIRCDRELVKKCVNIKDDDMAVQNRDIAFKVRVRDMDLLLRTIASCALTRIAFTAPAFAICAFLSRRLDQQDESVNEFLYTTAWHTLILLALSSVIDIAAWSMKISNPLTSTVAGIKRSEIDFKNGKIDFMHTTHQRDDMLYLLLPLFVNASFFTQLFLSPQTIKWKT